MNSLRIRLYQAVAAVGEILLLRFRPVVVTVAQLAFVVLANFAAFYFRFDGEIPYQYLSLFKKGLLPLAGVYVAGFLVFGLQRGLWRYAGMHDMWRIVGAGLASTGALYLVLHQVLGRTAYPRSIIVLTGLLSILLLGGIRFTFRMFLREWITIVGPPATRVLIVGAGNAGEMLARDLKSNPGFNYKPVAFADDDPNKRKATIHGVPVGGTIDEIPRLIQRYQVSDIIVAIPSASPTAMQRILAASQPCSIKTLPNVKQLLDGHVSMRQVRSLRLEDLLLQREPIQTDLQELHPLLERKCVLVTGAGGSIGSELCRQIARYKPSQLVLFERHENSLYAIDLELRESFPQMKTLPIVGDVTVPQQVNGVFRACKPNLIFHAAAHKHVPMMELNRVEAIRNNIIGTRIAGEAALAAGVEHFVLISTDKAVNPTSVMGATKRVAEQVAQDLNGKGKTRFTVVRFGNVLGSSGSVVPLFSEQIRKGGPVTVTHPEIKRFFMTIPEAVQLVLQASVMGKGGDVLVLDMGEQVLVADLARNMIALSGHVPDKDIKITYTGLRPGEKLYEELFDDEERVEPTGHAKINRAVGKHAFAPGELERHLRDLDALLQTCDAEVAIKKLRELVPNYKNGD